MRDSSSFLSHLPSRASLETVQKEAEEGSLEQRNQNSEFREELEKIAAALNNSFSHWKELQVQGKMVHIKLQKYAARTLGGNEIHLFFDRQVIQKLQTRQWRFLQLFKG